MIHPEISKELPHLAGGVPAGEGQFILERRHRLASPFLPWPREHLVDVGCGNGAQTLIFAQQFDRLTGVDIHPPFIAAFAAAVQARQLGNRVDALANPDGPLPVPDSSADCVTCFTVLEHVADEMATLAEIKRVLKPGGRLIMTVPNRWWIFETHGADLPLLPWNRVPLVSWWPKWLHDRYARARIYRKREIRTLVQQAGFTVDTVFNLTAPMDMIKLPWLQRAIRSTIFRSDRTSFPILATEIMLVATR
jgi:ubiquinone/menaquinone biosynthesis C-methylase UbiE